jgi:uncharacterized BrkB/YihY/UPF0761 family membrane protein
LFSIAPILVIAMAVSESIFFGPNAAEAQVLDQTRGLLGEAGAAAVQSLLSSAQKSGLKGVAAAIGVVTLILSGSIMVLLLWIYYSAQIFLLGAEFTHVFTCALGSRSGPAHPRR